jgi:opacity protein-like surface antigen
MTIKSLLLCTTLATCGLATAGLAQATNELIVTIADDERTLTVSDEIEWNGVERQPYVWIDASAVDDETNEVLNVALTFGAADWKASEPEMTVWIVRGGEVLKQLAAYEEEARGGLSVTIDSHALDGTSLSLTGTFEGTLGIPGPKSQGRPVDLSQGVPVTGSFNVTLDASE